MKPLARIKQSDSLDHSQLAYLNQELAHVETAITEIKYPNLVWERLVPVDTSVRALARTVKYRTKDITGQAKLGFNMMADDIPMVGLTKAEHEVTIIEGAVGYGWSLLEVLQAAELRESLDVELAKAARKTYEFTMEDLTLNGFGSVYSGLLNFPGITVLAAPDGAAGGTDSTWLVKTVDEILIDLFTLVDAVPVGSKEIEHADTVIMSPERLRLIGRLRLNDLSETTVLAYFLKAYKDAHDGIDLKIIPVIQLSTAGSGGVQRMMAYRNSPDVLRMYLPMPLTFRPAKEQNFKFEVPGWWRVGGLNIRSPASCRYMDGI